MKEEYETDVSVLGMLRKVGNSGEGSQPEARQWGHPVNVAPIQPFPFPSSPHHTPVQKVSAVVCSSLPQFWRMSSQDSDALATAYVQRGTC